jgi:MinD superfamily P-loop ATPase
MTVAVASGKGGAGKTSIASALAASLGPFCVMADCDVDAANGAIALGAHVRETEPYHAGPGFEIDSAVCTGCGLCADVCRFNAIRGDAAKRSFAIIPELCERCGACLDRCPAQAIRSFEKQAGRLFVSDTRLGITLVHAELVPGEDTSGKLVRKVRERADAVAGGHSIIVVDSPPGIGCPVIASLSGSDLVLVVVEASSSGIRDAERLMELVSSMKRKSVALINKTGLNASMDARAKSVLSNAGIPLAGEIPFDLILRSVEEQGRTWIDVEGETGDSVRRALGAIQAIIASLSRRNKDHDSRKELT